MDSNRKLRAEDYSISHLGLDLCKFVSICQIALVPACLAFHLFFDPEPNQTRDENQTKPR